MAEQELRLSAMPNTLISDVPAGFAANASVHSAILATRFGDAMQPTSLFPPTMPADPELSTPLQATAELPESVRDVLTQADADLGAGHYAAALDSLIAAVAVETGFVPAHVRIAELNLKLGRRRLARNQATTLLRLSRFDKNREREATIRKVLVHAGRASAADLSELVDCLVEIGDVQSASNFTMRLVRQLDLEGRWQEAIGAATRLRSLVPSDARAALEEVVLRIKAGDAGAVLGVWESAIAAGVDPLIAKASLAATADLEEEERWRLTAEVARDLRARPDSIAVEAHERTWRATGTSTHGLATHAILLDCVGRSDANTVLRAALTEPQQSSSIRAMLSLLLLRRTGQEGATDQRLELLTECFSFLNATDVDSIRTWPNLLGFVLQPDELGLELGELLLNRGDATAALNVLKTAHSRAPKNPRLRKSLARAYIESSDLATALSILDGLAGQYRADGNLDEMAAVLKQMSELAPRNLKVKGRLVDVYLQRGFATEAQEELIKRAEIELDAGRVHEAASSLARATGIIWASGNADEAFAILERLIGLCPESVEHRHTAAAYYLQAHRTGDAARHLRAIVDISLREGRRHEAVAALHQVIGLTPDDASAYLQLGDLLGSLREYAQAERVYRRLLLVTPGDAFAKAKAAAMAMLREQHLRQEFTSEAAS